MGRYRKIDSRIWNDGKFCALSERGKLVFFMLLTHPNMTALGAMRGTVQGLAAEIGWSPEAFREAFREALAKGMAEHDEKACFIALPKFINYNPPESPNVVKAWVGALDLLPECDLKNKVIQRAKEYAEGMREGFAKALPEAFAKSMPYPEQEQEPEQEQDKELVTPNGVTCPQAADPPPASSADCPAQRIVDLYHEKLPELPRCEKLTPTRRGYLRQRWREDLETLDDWSAFFADVRKSDFLMGKRPGRDGMPPFRANLEWLTKPANYAKFIEGKYHRAA